MKARTVCSLPGCPRLAVRRGRCAEHPNDHRPDDRAPAARNRGQRQRKALVAEHVATHGPVCPGWQRPPHHVQPSELTVDHVDPLATTNGRDTGRHAILCRPCNSAKGAR